MSSSKAEKDLSVSQQDRSFGLKYFLNAAASGGVACAIVSVAMVPFDVVRTRLGVPMEPSQYKTGIFHAMRNAVKDEGLFSLFWGLGPTVAGYFVQGIFKFGGFELFKVQLGGRLGEQGAWENRPAVFLASAAIAEIIADAFLRPIENVRVRTVKERAWPTSLSAGLLHMVKTEGVAGLYKDFGPPLLKQIPYSIAKFGGQESTAEFIFRLAKVTPDELSTGKRLAVSAVSGLVGGVLAAIVSHPIDGVLSRMNKRNYGSSGSSAARIFHIASTTGYVQLFLTGLPTRCFIAGTLAAAQFCIFDALLGPSGTKRFRIRNPDETL